MSQARPELQLGEFVGDLTYGDLPNQAIETIVRAFDDTVGVTVTGYGSDAGEIVTDAVAGGQRPEDIASALGVDRDEPPERAALRVGTAAHAMDYDDMSWTMDAHPSVTLVPAIMSVTPETRPSGREIVTAYATGFEVACAVAGPVTPATTRTAGTRRPHSE